ncbi:MAG: hypothetical protein K0Q79_3293 [Flavipsychrobacter sp.]|jgi:hypothetical protein|nr:hypothetical protein [Flavipsychrobacter sp.]
MNTLIQKDGVLTTLEDALQNQNTNGRPIKTFVGFNSGNRTFTVLMSLFELHEFTAVANDPGGDFVAQRKLDMVHATEIAKYILKALLSSVERKYQKHGKEVPETLTKILHQMGRQPYMSIPPLVASFRNCLPNGTNLAVEPLVSASDGTACFKIYINHGDIFWIVDGQHRRKGIQLVYEFLDYLSTYKKYPGKGSLYQPTEKKDNFTADELKIWGDCLEMSKSCTVNLEVHLGLGADQERQLFHDLNNLARKVEKSLALQFDNSNPINRFIKEALIDDLFYNEGYEIFEQDKINWTDERVGLTRKDLVAINAHLLVNKTTINNATPLMLEGKENIARAFWEKVLQIPGFAASAPRQNTVAAQPVVLKALAKLTFDFFFGKNKEWVTAENQQKLFDGLSQIDFSHANPMWKVYSLGQEEVNRYNLESLFDYLPDNSDANRDLGNYDNNEFRFGAKHNDIFPIIGDMIRWKLSLPKRKKDVLELELI